MSEKKRSTRNASSIVSYVPGRMRIKLQAGSRRPAFMNKLKEKMEAQEGMHRIKLNPTIGSLTLNFDRDRLTKDRVVRLLNDKDFE